MLGEGFITRAAEHVSNSLKERGITSLGREGIKNAVEGYIENLGLEAANSEINAIVDKVNLAGGVTSSAAVSTPAIPKGKSLKDIMQEAREAIENMDKYCDDLDFSDEWDMDSFIERAECFSDAITAAGDEKAPEVAEALKTFKETIKSYREIYEKLSTAAEVMTDAAYNLEDEY